ncbi:class I SAM-dependent methyltransferase [Holosporaceae bacterium 'Namur']|nr:class I SAM-dependent methyltransferase [Holosporaceae bacterium 'Namur']
MRNILNPISGNNYSTTQSINKDEINQYFKNITNERVAQWFEAFLKSTNQKMITGMVIQNLLLDFQGAQILKTPLSILDAGCGEGELAMQILQTWSTQLSSVSYYGIDNEERFINTIQEALIKLKVYHRLQQGSCFNSDIDNLPNDMNIILASNVAYYAPNVMEFIHSLLSKKSHDGILLSIHESSTSIPNILRGKYGAEVDTKTAFKIKDCLDSTQFRYCDFMIPSIITLPKDYHKMALDLLKSTSSTINNHSIPVLNTEYQHFKMLLEFIVQTSLESLKYKGQLNDYIDDVLIVAEKNKGSIPVESSVVLVVPESVRNKICDILDRKGFSKAYEISHPNLGL